MIPWEARRRRVSGGSVTGVTGTETPTLGSASLGFGVATILDNGRDGHLRAEKFRAAGSRCRLLRRIDGPPSYTPTDIVTAQLNAA